VIARNNILSVSIFKFRSYYTKTSVKTAGHSRKDNPVTQETLGTRNKQTKNMSNTDPIKN
jgi:hypothetical protein